MESSGRHIRVVLHKLNGERIPDVIVNHRAECFYLKRRLAVEYVFPRTELGLALQNDDAAIYNLDRLRVLGGASNKHKSSNRISRGRRRSAEADQAAAGFPPPPPSQPRRTANIEPTRQQQGFPHRLH